MAGVPQKTLNWLYDVLRREYRDPNRTYSDLAQTLTQYPSLAPRTDVYTSENGAPALLLNLKGTLPVDFRGTTYRYPIALWIPHAYPYEAPIAYVTPTGDMVVRPGQHVSVSDGKIYHHYLARWSEAWDRSSVIEFLKALADIFAREPPVMTKPQQMAIQPPQRQPGGPPIPPFPDDQRRYGSQPPLSGSLGRTGSPGQTGPPRPPPKHSSEAYRPGSAGPPSPGPRPGRYDAPPPLPPPVQASRPAPPPQATYGNGMSTQPRPASQYLPQRTSSLRQEYPPRGPQQYQHQSADRPQPLQHARDGSSPQMQSDQYNRMQPAPPQHMMPQLQAQPQGPESQQPQRPYQGQQQHQPYMQHPQTQYQAASPSHQSPYPYQQQPPFQGQPQPHPQRPQSNVIPQTTPAQPKDLLSEDDPFQIALPTSRSQVPAPPIPTNPEKTAIQTALSHIILQHLHTQVQQTQANALPSLASQHVALTNTSQNLNSELQQLQTLSAQLQSNISALQTTLKSANTTISAIQDPKSQSHPDNIPAIDQIIIPPTVVARQLYDAVAEQRGYEAAIFALNEAFVRGRIGAEIWDRKVRQCAREEMRRKWLVRKIGNGLGLEEA